MGLCVKQVIRRSRSSGLSKKLGGNWKMRNTIAALFLFFAPVAIFAAPPDETMTQEVVGGLRYVHMGPVCFPGDPCGPQPRQLLKDIGFVMGLACPRGDSCGWSPVAWQELYAPANSIGPVCFPGDPCGPHQTTVLVRDIESFIGPVCFPGDPCGPRPAISPMQSKTEWERY
jgi:hypothetical protein